MMFYIFVPDINVGDIAAQENRIAFAWLISKPVLDPPAASIQSAG